MVNAIPMILRCAVHQLGTGVPLPTGAEEAIPRSATRVPRSDSGIEGAYVDLNWTRSDREGVH